MKKERNKINPLFIIISIFAFIVIAFPGVLLFLNHGRLIYGLKIGILNVGGLKIEQALAKFQEKATVFESQKIELKLKKFVIETNLKSLGAKLNSEKMLADAFTIGHGGNVLKIIKDQISALFLGKTLMPEIEWSGDVLKNFSYLYLSDFIKEFQNASLKYERGVFALVPAKSGQDIAWEIFKKEIGGDTFFFKANQEYKLSLKIVFPEIRDEETETAKLFAEKILAASPLKIVLEDKNWEIKKENLGAWIKFLPVFEGYSENKILGLGLDRDALTHFLLALAPSVNRKAVDARLAFEDGKIVIKKPAETGRELLLEDSAEKIKEDILALKTEPKLILKETPAAISEETLGSLGIEMLIGRGESNFGGSSAARVNNIKVGSSKFDGHLIKPGEEFSFNETLGIISAEAGYQPGLVIKDNKLIPEYGGGICQVSTTMFRVAVWSGLEITERYPHSFPVQFYNPQGFDATVYPPRPDLRFKNNTEGYILIQRKIEDNNLIFEMYGKDESKEVKIKGPTVYERNLEEDSMKTVLWQEVYQKGELLFKKGFWSYYKSPSLYPVERNPLE